MRIFFSGISDQWRFRSACTSMHSDHNLPCLLFGSYKNLVSILQNSNSINSKTFRVEYWMTYLTYLFNRFFNPFPHIDTFWRLCSRQLIENIVSKEEIAQNEQFLLLPQYFPILVRRFHSIIEIFYFLNKYGKSRLLQNCRMWERVNPFLHEADGI